MLTTLPPVDGDGPLLSCPGRWAWWPAWSARLLSRSAAACVGRRRCCRCWPHCRPGRGHPARRTPSAIRCGCRARFRRRWPWAGWRIRARRASAPVHGGSSAGVASPWVARSSCSRRRSRCRRARSSPATTTPTAPWSARGWSPVRHRPLPLAARGLPQYVDQGEKDDPANVFDKTLFTVTGARPDPRADRRHGRLRRAGLGRLERRPAGCGRRLVPACLLDHRQPGQRDEVDGDGHDRRRLFRRLVADHRRAAGRGLRLGDPEAKSESFRYNLATSTAVVPSGIRRGDTYSFTAVQPDDELTARDAGLDGARPPRPREPAFVKEPATDWSEKANTADGSGARDRRPPQDRGQVLRRGPQVRAGVPPRALPPAPLRRIPQRPADRRQRRAVRRGHGPARQRGRRPARVVMGAVVPEDGVVTGEDVEAWVELRAADGSWRTLPTEEFMSKEPPAEQLPETNTPMSGTVVPPPAPIPPPSDAGDQSDADLKERKATKDDKDEEESSPSGSRLGRLRRQVRRRAAVPAGGSLAAIVGLKVLRRRRRRGAVVVSARFVGAWRELVDHAQTRPTGAARTHVTRRDSRARSGRSLLRRWPAAPTASSSGRRLRRRAPRRRTGNPWTERKAMSHAVGRRRRWLAAISLASLRRGKSTPSAASAAPRLRPVRR